MCHRELIFLSLSLFQLLCLVHQAALSWLQLFAKYLNICLIFLNQKKTKNHFSPTFIFPLAYEIEGLWVSHSVYSMTWWNAFNALCFSFRAQYNHCVDDLSVPVLVFAVLALIHALCNRWDSAGNTACKLKIEIAAFNKFPPKVLYLQLREMNSLIDRSVFLLFMNASPLQPTGKCALLLENCLFSPPGDVVFLCAWLLLWWVFILCSLPGEPTWTLRIPCCLELWVSSVSVTNND